MVAKWMESYVCVSEYRVIILLLRYIPKRKRTIPSILLSHIPLTLLYDVQVFFIKNFTFF